LQEIRVLLATSLAYEFRLGRFRWAFYLSRHLNQKQRRKLLLSLSQAATCCYQSNRSKIEAIPLSALPKDTTSELAGLSSH